jgi:alkylation response protein AidB-like acyl-CoA dehydrogenase
VIGSVGGGFSLAQKWIQEGRITWGAPVGIAQRALDMMIDYSRHRVTFGRPLADRQAVQFMITDSAMELHAATWPIPMKRSRVLTTEAMMSDRVENSAAPKITMQSTPASANGFQFSSTPSSHARE